MLWRLSKWVVLRMSMQEIPPHFALFSMVTGYYVSRALYVVARLRIADHLREGARSVDDLAIATGAHAPSLKRVIRLLVGAGLFTEDVDGRFALTPIGACLRADVPGSMRAAALLFGGITWQAWSDLLHCVETGEPAFRRVFGLDPFDYMARHPDEAANFDAAMADFTKQIAAAVVAAYDFSPLRRIVDVGGGSGALLGGILKANPTLAGLLFDLPEVADRAVAPMRELGLTDRCEIVGGDFFKTVPAGGDAYLLKHVIHDWNDDRAAAILRTCRRATGPEAKLLIIEGVYRPRIDQSDESRGATANDVNMLVCTGGRQRSEAEFRSLFEATGFQVDPDPGDAGARQIDRGTSRLKPYANSLLSAVSWVARAPPECCVHLRQSLRASAPPYRRVRPSPKASTLRRMPSGWTR
jgi:SAM-dependent methyltransferase